MDKIFIILNNGTVQTKEEHMRELNNNPESWREQD